MLAPGTVTLDTKGTNYNNYGDTSLEVFTRIPTWLSKAIQRAFLARVSAVRLPEVVNGLAQFLWQRLL